MEKKARKKWRYLIPIFLILLGLVGYNIFLYHYDTQFTGGYDAAYLSNQKYAKVFNVWDLTYSGVINAYGESPSIERIWTARKNAPFYRAVYPGFDMIYLWNEAYQTNRMAYLVVTSETLRFGKYDIGLGSAREDVWQAYGNDLRISEKNLAGDRDDFPDIDEGYSGDDWCGLLFAYDMDGIVTMMLYRAPFF